MLRMQQDENVQKRIATRIEDQRIGKMKIRAEMQRQWLRHQGFLIFSEQRSLCVIAIYELSCYRVASMFRKMLSIKDKWIL